MHAADDASHGLQALALSLPHDVIKLLICPTEQVKIGKSGSKRSHHATLHGVVLRIFDPDRRDSQRPADAGRQ
jgi:hypothetical protein